MLVPYLATMNSGTFFDPGTNTIKVIFDIPTPERNPHSRNSFLEPLLGREQQPDVTEAGRFVYRSTDFGGTWKREFTPKH